MILKVAQSPLAYANLWIFVDVLVGCAVLGK